MVVELISSRLRGVAIHDMSAPSSVEFLWIGEENTPKASVAGMSAAEARYGWNVLFGAALHSETAEHYVLRKEEMLESN